MYRRDMKRYYKIAGIDVCISGKESEINIDGSLLDVFSSEKTSSAYNYEFQLVETLSDAPASCTYKEDSYIVYQKDDEYIRYIGSTKPGVSGAYMRIAMKEKCTKVEVLKSCTLGIITAKIVLNALGIEHLAAGANGLLLHGAYIVCEGKGIIFTAPSGVGKSTQAELWKTFRGAQIINGDRVLIRIVDGKVYACGLPFSGSSKYCQNVTVPLNAIVYLRQDETTTINNLQGKTALGKLLEGSSIAIWHKDDMSKSIGTMSEILKNVPMYFLKCTPDESAVIALENELRKEW